MRRSPSETDLTSSASKCREMCKNTNLQSPKIQITENESKCKKEITKITGKLKENESEKNKNKETSEKIFNI